MAVPLGRRVLREVGGAGATLSLRGPKVAKVENFGKVGTVDASLTKNALARAAFFNRLGEMRGRSSKNQRYRASGLTMVSSSDHPLEHGLFELCDRRPQSARCAG